MACSDVRKPIGVRLDGEPALHYKSHAWQIESGDAGPALSDFMHSRYVRLSIEEGEEVLLDSEDPAGDTKPGPFEVQVTTPPDYGDTVLTFTAADLFNALAKPGERINVGGLWHAGYIKVSPHMLTVECVTDDAFDIPLVLVRRLVRP